MTALMDFGEKRNMTLCLNARGCDVTVLPETTCAAVCFRGSHPEAPAQYARLMDYLRAHALAPADFSREITMIDYGLTSDPDKFVTEIRIPVRAAE